MNGIISPHAIIRHSLMLLIPNHTQNYAVTYTINSDRSVYAILNSMDLYKSMHPLNLAHTY